MRNSIASPRASRSSVLCRRSIRRFAGTLPRVWIPPAELRDQREMLPLRMSLVRMNWIYTGIRGERNSFPDRKSVV